MVAFCVIASVVSGCFDREGARVNRTAAGESYELVISGVTLIDGRGGLPLPGVNVYVRDGLIAAISAAPPVEQSVKVVDGTGLFMTPGFVDLHVHFPEDSTVYQAMLDRLLEFGITTILNPGARPGAGVELRGKLSRGELRGPRMLTAGRLIDGPPGEFHNAEWVARATTEEQLLDEIQSQLNDGVDYIKLYAGLAPDLVERGILAGHAAGVQVVGHLESTNWGTAARAGIDMLVHSGWATPMEEIIDLDDMEGATDAEWYRAYRDAPAGEPFATLVSALVTNDVVVVPTLSISQVSGTARDATLLAQFRPELAPEADVPGWWGENWRAGHPDYFAEDETEAELLDTLFMPALFGILKAYYERGVRLGVGTDVGNSWMTPGVSFHHEMGLYQDAGIPPLDILTMATRNGAEALGLDTELGTIEVGKRADFLLFESDPSADIRNTNTLRTVFQAGVELPISESDTVRVRRK